jgi:phosphatidylserine decarboxylase
MSHVETLPSYAEVQPLPANLTSTQPGGGVCMRIELAWGRIRRWYLRTFREGYVKRMRELQVGNPTGCPHEVFDSRDLKFYRNQTECHWPAAVDPFAWRERIPFARWGLAELQLMTWPLVALAALAVVTGFWYLAIAPAVCAGLVIWFFRDPPRRVPQQAGLWVSPADGRIAEITRLDHDDFVGGPATRIGIFLSIFNVHINRAPVAGRVLELRYVAGPFLNALDPKSALVNENLWIGCVADEPDLPASQRFIVRQIAGAIARRIVCDLRPGQSVARGEKFGMIKLGSRTELILPADDDYEVAVQVGQRVKAGETVLVRPWRTNQTELTT